MPRPDGLKRSSSTSRSLRDLRIGEHVARAPSKLSRVTTQLMPTCLVALRSATTARSARANPSKPRTARVVLTDAVDRHVDLPEQRRPADQPRQLLVAVQPAESSGWAPARVRARSAATLAQPRQQRRLAAAERRGRERAPSAPWRRRLGQQIAYLHHLKLGQLAADRQTFALVRLGLRILRMFAATSPTCCLSMPKTENRSAPRR